MLLKYEQEEATGVEATLCRGIKKNRLWIKTRIHEEFKRRRERRPATALPPSVTLQLISLILRFANSARVFESQR